MTLAMLNSEIPGIHSGRTPFHSRTLSESYKHFYRLANQGGRTMRFGSAEDFQPDGTLHGHWVPQGEGWMPVAETEALDMVFDKLGGVEPLFMSTVERLIEMGVPIFGHYGLNRFTGDKWACYQALTEHLALTRLMEQDRGTIEEQIDGFFEVMDAHYHHHDNVAVIKPRWGWESRGLYLLAREGRGVRVHLLSGDQVTHPSHLEQVLDSVAAHPYVIQAWVNTTQGVPELGLVSERHDCRFVFVVTEPGSARFVQAYVKTPQGMLYYPLERFPRSVFEKLESVGEVVAQRFPYGIFCIDLMRDISGDWYVTELNDQVGFNIDFSSERDVRGVTELMQTYLHEIDMMRENRHQPRYRTAR